MSSTNLAHPLEPVPRFEGAVVPVAALDGGTRAEMRALLARHFDGVRPGDFDADLADKDRSLVVRDADGRVKGFSTMKLYRSAAAGGARVLFSGDTIVDPDVWRSPVAIRTWLRHAIDLSAEASGDRLDWFLLSSGHRTFRLMAGMFQRFHPCPEGRDPALAARLDAYARERYGDAYDAARGVVRLPRSVHRLRAGVGDVTSARLRDPAVALFASLNPGHAEGDELACVCELSLANLTRAGRRVLGSA